MRFGLFLALCSLAAVPAPGAGDLPGILARVDQAAAAFKAMTADVRQLYHTAVINDDTVDVGAVALKRVKLREYRMLINLSQPDPRTVALDGRKAELYLPNIKTVQEYDLGKHRGLVDQFLLLGFGSSGKELASAYDIRLLGTETVGGQSSAHLELTPKSPDVLQHLSKVELWVSEKTGYPAQQQFRLPGGDYRTVTYTNVRINPDLPDAAVKLQLPKGVKREYPAKIGITGPTMQAKSSRLLYLDWVRGLAALIMLQGHVFHSFLRNDLRDGGAYVLSQFVGGMPPAIFLFLTGVTLAFLMHSGERKGLPPARRVWTAMRRAGYLFAVAYLFRLQLWMLGQPESPWTDLLKVDVLNCMGMAILCLSLMAVLRTRARVRVGAMAGLAIAAASPVVTQFHPAWLPDFLRHYVAPDYNHFSFFPWATFLAFGVSAGSLLRLLKPEQIDRAMQWSALLGVAMIAAAYYFSGLPYSLYPKAEFWLDSPAQILIKQGVILLVLPFAFLWTEYGAGEGWSWVRQLGTTSLLVYWVHIELVYGRWLWFFKNQLDVTQTVVTAVAVILFMLLLSLSRTHNKRWRAALAGFFSPTPARVPGD